MQGYGQSKLESAVESTINIVVGFGLSVAANWIILHLQGYTISWKHMSWLAFWMTVLSFARSYLLRRAFNWWYLRRLNHARKT